MIASRRLRFAAALAAVFLTAFAAAAENEPPPRPMPELVAELKKSNPPDPKIAQELARYGAGAVPELVKIAGEVEYVTTGVMDRVPVRPYIPHARAVIAALTDPAAVPALKKIDVDSALGVAARKRLLELNASFTREEVAALIAEDKKNYAVEDRMRDEYPRLFKSLAPEDAAKLLMDFLRPGQDILFFSLNDGENLHTAKPADLQFVRDALALLAKTGSPAAKKFLERQAKSLTKASAGRRSDLKSANQMSFYTAAGREDFKKDADMIDELLVDYKKAIDALAAAKP